MKKMIRAFILGTLLMLGGTSVYAAEKLDLNTATTEQLQSVKGIGPKTALAIDEYRKTHHGFKSIDELKEVKGIGEKNLVKFKEHLEVWSVKPVTPNKK